MFTKKSSLLAAALVIAAPAVAMAHPGHGPEGGFGSGFLHPLTGLDHMLAIIAVSLLSVRLGGRSLWAVPVAFVACCGIGGVIAWSGTTLPMVEVMIAASLLVCGVLLARRDAAPLFAIAAIPLFGIFHGYAHIAEMSQSVGLESYAAGLLLASVGLIVLTIGVGVSIRHLRSNEVLGRLCRVAGAGFAAAAMFMLFV